MQRRTGKRRSHARGRSPQTHRAGAHLAGPNTYAITLQNGLGNADAIAEVFAEVFAASHILIGVTDFPADLVAATRVTSHGNGYIWLGALEPSGMRGAEAARR